MPGLTGGTERAELAMLDDVTLSDLFGHEVMTGAHVTAIRFLSGTMAAGLGDGTVRFWARDAAEPETVPVHAGAILVMDGVPGGDTVITGGDDGRICLVGPAGAQTIGDSRGKWIDAVGASPSGGLAFAQGKGVTIIHADGSRREVATPSTVGGLAFAADGRSIAVAHYGGVTLVSLDASPDKVLGWAGSHVGVCFSPDSRFVVSAMNENALHGWRVADGLDMRMDGYPARPRSMSWSPGGAWLATAGAECVVMWPFKAEAGPMGQSAMTLAEADAIVTSVKCHPVSDVVAAGYDNGAIVFARRSDGALVAVRDPDGDRITDMAFDDGGRMFGYGTEGGTLGWVDLERADG